MKSKNSDKGQRRSGRARRSLKAVYLAAIAALGVAVVAGIMLGNRGSKATSEQIGAATGTLSASQTFHDFGRVSMKSGKVSYEFAVRNDSGAPALVEKVFTSCMCTEASLVLGGERIGPFGMPGHAPIPPVNRVIQPGQEAVVEAVFDPNAHGPAGVGRNDRQVSLLMGGQKLLQLQFTAFVTP